MERPISSGVSATLELAQRLNDVDAIVYRPFQSPRRMPAAAMWGQTTGRVLLLTEGSTTPSSALPRGKPVLLGMVLLIGGIGIVLVWRIVQRRSRPSPKVGAP